MELTKFIEKMESASDKVDEERFKRTMKKCIEQGNAIIIAIEELNELAYAIYNNMPVSYSVIEEICDVTIVTNQLNTIFDYTDEQINEVIDKISEENATSIVGYGNKKTLCNRLLLLSQSLTKYLRTKEISDSILDNLVGVVLAMSAYQKHYQIKPETINKAINVKIDRFEEAFNNTGYYK